MSLFRMNRKELTYSMGLLRLLVGSVRKKPDFPVFIALQTINRCNSRCPMCPYSDTTAHEELSEIDDSTYDNLIEQMAREPNFETLIFSFQNEPLLDRKACIRARKFKEKMPDKLIQIVTNGSFLNPNIIPELYESFDIVSISVSALSKQTYGKVMRGLNWEKINKNLEYISNHSELVEKTVLRFIKQEENLHEEKKFKKYWNEKGFKVFGFEISSRLGLVKNFELIKPKSSFLTKPKLFIFKLIGKILVPICPIIFISMYVRSNGDAVLCFNDYSKENIYGNIKKQSIRDIFNSDKYKKTRERAKAKKIPDNNVCGKCDLYYDGIWLTV